jgi:hypothetical protein
MKNKISYEILVSTSRQPRAPWDVIWGTIVVNSYEHTSLQEIKDSFKRRDKFGIYFQF